MELKIDQIFEKGGMKSLIEEGEIQNEIEKSAFEFQENIDSRKTILVGVNEFVNENDKITSGASFKDDSKNRIEKLKAFKENRDIKVVEKSLKKLADAAITDENLIPHIINCVENNCTLGEIIITLKNVFGEYLE